MWTQFVLRALSDLPTIIAAVEHNHSSKPGQGGQKLADVNASMRKIEGDASADEGTVAMRLQAIEALVGYATQLAAAERGMRPGRTGGPAADAGAPPPIVSPSRPTIATATPDQSLAATEAENERQRLEQLRLAEEHARAETARMIVVCFSFPPDDGQLTAYLTGRSTVADFVKDMVGRNGGVVPENLPAPFRPVL